MAVWTASESPQTTAPQYIILYFPLYNVWIEKSKFVSTQKRQGEENMFCQKCGKEISNQAKFCNYCGTPVNDVQPQAAPASQAAPQAKSAKKGRAGQTLVTIIVALVVYFVVRGVTENALTNKQRVSGTPWQPQGIIEKQ